MADLLMPSLGADMDDGTLLEWRIKPGDRVERGDIVAVVDTDKAAIEIEIFETGVVRELLVSEGEKVPVGTPLAHLGAPAEAVEVPEPAVEAPVVAEAAVEPSAATEKPKLPTATPPPEDVRHLVPERPHATPAARKHALELGLDLAAIEGTGRHGVVTKDDVARAAAATRKAAEAPVAAPPITPAAPVTASGSRPRVSPLARRLARQAGLDLAAIEATGPNGVITQRDVERAAGAHGSPNGAPAEPPTTKGQEPPAKATPPDAKEERYAAMRRAIAAAMSRSKREIPHYYLSTHVDMSRALTWLEETNLQLPIVERLIPAALLLRATALAAREVPALNGFWIDDAFRPADGVHLGVGISLRQGGLIAPAIHDADRKGIDTLMADLRDLVKRARKLQLRSSEMTDATMTTTNLGDQGVESVYGIVYPPQVALVGFGRIAKRPWADGDLLGVRPLLKLTLAADHRASDGHVGGLFMAAVERYLHSPEEL